MSATTETPAATVEATDTPFSLELSEEQRDIRDWVHGFAEDVIRPAAPEWDEREETPWPIIQEAAKIGLYGFEGIAQFFADPTGPDAADRQRGAVLGRRRHRHVDHGHVAGRRRDLRPGHARADRRVDPAVLRHASTSRRSPRSASPSPTPAPTSPRCAPAPGTTRPPTSGSSTARRRGRPTAASPTCTSSSPRSTAELGSRGQAAFVIPPGTPGPQPGREGQEARPARLAHRRRLPRRRAPARPLPARRQGEARRAPRPGPRGPQGAQPGRDGDLRGHPPDGRRAGDRHRPRGLRVRARLREGRASSSAARSSRTRRSRSCSPT